MKTYAYVVRYTDACDAGCPIFEAIYRANSAREAEIKFDDGNSDDGWRVVGVERARDAA